MNTTSLHAKDSSPRVAIPSQGPHPDDEVDSRFGRCRWFLLHSSGGEWEAIPRDPDLLESGAGRDAANVLSRHGVTVLLAGKVGPKAMTALQDAGIEVVEGMCGSCQDALEIWLGSRRDA